MPFVKVGENRYKSPSGKVYTQAQIKAYYAKTKGKAKKKKK